MGTLRMNRQGGRRSGAGRPRGSVNKKGVKGWLPLGAQLSPAMTDFLEDMKVKGYQKSWVIDTALRRMKQTGELTRRTSGMVNNDD